MEEGKVLLKLSKNVAHVIINRPERMNAIDGGVWRELSRVAENINTNPEIKAVILRGEGKAFSSGLDLKAAASPEGINLGTPLRDGTEMLKFVSNAFTSYEKMAPPVIAAIKGACLGAAMELALACDIRIASEDAVFSIPEVVFGLVPDCGGTQRLPRIVGPGMAKELIFTGRRIDSAEALRIGLVNHVFPEGKLMEEAEKIAGEIVNNAADAVQASKRAINFAMSSSMDSGLAFETATAEMVLGDRAKEVFKK